MSDDEQKVKDGEWMRANVEGPNARLVGLLEKMAELNRLAVEKKLAELKVHVNSEAARMNSPEAWALSDAVNKLEVE